MIRLKAILLACLRIRGTAIFVTVSPDKHFLAFRVSTALKDEIQDIATSEARSISQICELLLVEGIETYKKEGPKFIQRIITKQKPRSK